MNSSRMNLMDQAKNPPVNGHPDGPTADPKRDHTPLPYQPPPPNEAHLQANKERRRERVGPDVDGAAARFLKENKLRYDGTAWTENVTEGVERRVAEGEVKVRLARFYRTGGLWVEFGQRNPSLSGLGELMEAVKAAAFTPLDPEKDRDRLLASQGISILSVYDLDTDESPIWAVEGIMADGEPMVIGGPKKTFKSSLAVALAVSLVTGKPFLGRFRVNGKRRVVLFSGESGKRKTFQTVVRVARAYKIKNDKFINELVHEGTLTLLDGVPHFGTEDGFRTLESIILLARPDVMILDPVYLSLLTGGSVNAANIFEMGSLLSRLAAVCRQHSVTPILLHHANRRIAPKRPMELDDLAFAGLPEFARQWFLVNSRQPFNPNTGLHSLVLNVGGSAGHSSQWLLKVEEGPCGSDGTRKKFAVDMATYTPTGAEAGEDDSSDNVTTARPCQLGNKILAQLPPDGSWTEQKTVKEALGDVQGGRLKRAVEALREAGRVEVKKENVTNSRGKKHPVIRLRLLKVESN